MMNGKTFHNLFRTFIAALLVITSSFSLAETAKQDPKQLENFVLEYVKQKADQKLFDTKITVRPISSTIELPQCLEKLNIIDRNPDQFAGRMQIGIMCNQPFWKIYVPATVNGSQKVIKTAKGILKGTVIGIEDLQEAMIPYNQVPSQVILDINTAVGMQAKRHLSAERILKLKDLTKPTIVFKNKPVSIVTAIGQVIVKTSGIALADAAEGEQVAVKNSRSEKTVYGIVTGPNEVKIP